MNTLALLGWATLAIAAPSVNYPLADQHPPVARVNSPFVFTLLPASFNSTGNVTYTASDLPSWLNFSSDAPAFQGTPTASDVGTANVTVTAKDSTGSASSSVQLIVSNASAPVVQLSFPAQIADPSSRQFASAEVMPDGTGVTVPPQWSFSLGWNGNTFATTNTKGSQRLYYSAHVRGTTSLPAWLEFSNKTFTFNGNAPAVPAAYPVVVTASDYWGYTAAETSFVLSVGTGEAPEFGTNFTAINTTAYSQVDYKVDTSKITVGGRAASASDFVITPDLSKFKWLSFSNNTISGTVPESLLNGTVTPLAIPLKLASTNASNTLSNIAFVNMNVVPYFFTTNQLPNATTTNGTTFAYSIEQYVRDKTVHTNATVMPREAASWLIYYPENYTIVGSPPHNVSYNSLDVAFQGWSNNVTATTNMHINITGIEKAPTPGEPTPVPTGSISHGTSKTKKIIIGVVVGVGGFLLLLALLLLLFCCRRRRQREKKQVSEKIRKSQIQAIIPGFGGRRDSLNRPATLGGNTLTKSVTQSPAKSAMTDTTCAVTPRTPTSKSKAAVVEDTTPRRLGDINGLFRAVDGNDEEALASQRDLDRRASFIGKPEAIAVRDPVKQPSRADMSRSAESQDSLASWESPRSFHWSDEDHYLPPIMPALASTTNSGVSLADEPRAPPPAAQPEEARPLPGFYPRFPRNMRPGDPAPFMSNDEIPRSQSGFSEVRRERSSQSLDDSFRGTGSALGTVSGRYGSSSNDGFRARANHNGSGSDESGSSFQAPSQGLGRFTSSGVLSANTFSSDEHAIVSTAERQSMEARRSSIVQRHAHAESPSPAPIDFSAPRPLSILAGPIMPSGLNPPPAARRRQSSSRRPNTARIHATREHIVGPSTPVPPADEHLAVVDYFDANAK